ncbi:hypothetical protein G7Y89_g3011 [Cudoniella acicularis]|uniref:Uncharacterized protein n=1 Tax=Cudoniella acicularis TaxID=354080 RepID=A0A8H4W830_9HELO|nr:hypothetical protein G7Y89_g3011 [Cudoniella acicularis]
MASILSQISAYLPQHEGLLPQWLLFVSIVSVANSIQSYITLDYTAQVYLGPATSPSSKLSKPIKPASLLAPNSPATPLSSRTFGTWTLIQSLVRLYAAYNIGNEAFYQLAFLTYAVAWAHFFSEWKEMGEGKGGDED